MIPQGGTKNINRRPALGMEGALPSNLLNELNSVLSKSSRGARSNDWQEVKSGAKSGPA